MIGIGVGIIPFIAKIARAVSDYVIRVTSGGGVVEASDCANTQLTSLDSRNLYNNASFIIFPSGYKASVAYAEIPTNGNGDLTWTRTSTAIRTNSSGLLESMATGVPRLSYMYGSCPSVLLEPQRTNLGLYSQQLDDASWGKINSSVTANSTTSPDGTTNADTFTADGTNNQHYIGGTTSGNITSGATYTYTIYAKKNTNNFIQLWISNVFGGMFANFDLNNGVVGTLGIGSGGSNPTSSIQSVGNGWYRCSMTFVPTSTGVVGLLVAMTSSASAVRGEANTLSTSVFLWGAQLEAGAYPTTYIPTTSATATRVADTFTRNNIYTNGLISASGGTLYAELRNNVAYSRDSTGDVLGIGDSSFLSTNCLVIRNGGGVARLGVAKRISGALTTLFTTTTDTVKIAIKWNGTSADIFQNGVKVVSATAFTTTNMEFLVASGTQVPTFIQAMALYPTPLSDAQCQIITS